jgi:hypothetical protein
MRNLFTSMQTMMCRAGFLPDVAMLILLATVVVMNTCMLLGPASGWSDTIKYRLLSQLQLPFAENIIAYVLCKCENLVGVMVFGHKAYDNIMPWLRTHFSQKFLIQNMFLNHPQNIQWSYLLEHARNYVETFRAIMNLLGVDIPPLEGVVQLRFLMTKKRTLDMIEFVEGFVNSEVLKAVHQRSDKVKIARTAKVEEIMETLNSVVEAEMAAKRVEKKDAGAAAMAAKRAEKEAAAAAAAAAAAVAVARRKEMKETEAASEVAAAVAMAAVARRKEMKETKAASEVAAAVAMAVAIEKRRSTAIEKRKEREADADAAVAVAIVTWRTTVIEKRKEREAEADAKEAVAALAVAAVATEKEGDSGGGGGGGGDACGKHIQSVQPRGMHQDETS